MVADLLKNLVRKQTGNIIVCKFAAMLFSVDENLNIQKYA
jgi:hypothetical protein